MLFRMEGYGIYVAIRACCPGQGISRTAGRRSVHLYQFVNGRARWTGSESVRVALGDSPVEGEGSRRPVGSCDQDAAFRVRVMLLATKWITAQGRDTSGRMAETMVDALGYVGIDMAVIGGGDSLLGLLIN